MLGTNKKIEMITASIVLYKSDRDELRKVISNVDSSTIVKLFIIDNSPTDELRSFVCGLSSKVEYIYGQGNVGYGTAHNIAIRNAIRDRVKYHVVINPDIEFEHGVVDGLCDYMESNSDVGQVMPKVLYPNGEIQPLCKLLPTPIDLIGRKFIPSSLNSRRNSRYEISNYDYSTPLEIPSLSGCFMFLRVEALERVDGFDERFFMYCEDLDLCRRIKKIGYKTVCNPTYSITHVHKKESYVNRKLLVAHIRSAIYYFSKWGWFFDRDRRRVNGELLSSLEKINKLAKL